jgi:hypothetical protein
MDVCKVWLNFQESIVKVRYITPSILKEGTPLINFHPSIKHGVQNSSNTGNTRQPQFNPTSALLPRLRPLLPCHGPLTNHTSNAHSRSIYWRICSRLDSSSCSVLATTSPRTCRRSSAWNTTNSIPHSRCWRAGHGRIDGLGVRHWSRQRNDRPCFAGRSSQFGSIAGRARRVSVLEA